MNGKKKMISYDDAYLLVKTAIEDLETKILDSAYGNDGIECDWAEESVNRIEDIFRATYESLEKRAYPKKVEQSQIS